MVKYTQTIRRQKPTNCLSAFDHFVGLALKGLMVIYRFAEEKKNWIKIYSSIYHPFPTEEKSMEGLRYNDWKKHTMLQKNCN